MRAGEVAKALVGAEGPRIPMKLTAGDKVEPGGRGSQA